MQSPDALAGDAMNRARVILLNDVAIGDAVAAKLVTFVEGGGGLLMALGQRASWPSSRAAWLPASIGPPVDRTRGAAARLSGMDYGHADLRAVPRAAQRRFLDGALLFVSRA